MGSNKPSFCSGQRGALFGLDARLALAIFAVIVLIAGYVSYGRIGMAKQAALIGELQAFEGALTQYQADMGTFYPFTLNKSVNETDTSTDLTALWDRSRVKPGFQGRWNGPYLSRETLLSRGYGVFSVFYASASNRSEPCTEAADCAIWLTLTQVPEAEWNQANSAYDEGGGKYPEKADEAILTGRIQAETPANPRVLYLKLAGRDAP